MNLITIKGHTFFDIFTEKSIIVDAGANEGAFSKELVKRITCKEIHLIEPDSKILANIKIAENEVKHNLALGKNNEEIDFYVDPNNSEANTAVKELIPSGKETTIKKVQQQSLKTFLFEQKITKVDLLKLDIEGAEWDVLETFTSEEFKSIEQISVEFHNFLDKSKEKKSLERIRQLEKLGYQFINCILHKKYEHPYYNCLFIKKKYLN